MKEREKLGSRLGFILISAGCAIGIGNVWKFPYMAGQGGGGTFVLFYLIFLALLGLPVMTMEFSVGRASQKSPVKAYYALEKPGQKWHIHGYITLIGCYLLMMFYTTVGGWMLAYFFKIASGTFTGLDTEAVGNVFNTMLSNPGEMTFWMVIVTAFGFGTCCMGLQKGVERITKVMMICLLALIVVLAVHSVTLDGAMEGVKFYLVPNLDNIRAAGLGNVIFGALSQAFFTLSIGIGAMAIFGSYIDKERSLTGEAINVLVLDTLVAFMAGLIIFPACAAYGIEAGQGPSLIFITLPNVFNHMAGGRFWGTLFFVFMTFAALSTVLAVFENILSCCMDLFGWSRKKACLINAIALLILSLPCALGFNLLSGIHPLGGSSNFLDLEDFLVSNIILPVGSLIFLLFAVSKRGWGWENFMAEANAGRGLKVKNWMRGYMTYILPFLFLGIFLIGLVTYFQ